MLLLFGYALNSYSQSSHTVTGYTANDECTKGAAGVEILGLLPNDTLTVTWSTGQTGVLSINELEAGNYSVHVKLNSKLDTTIDLKVKKIN